MSTPENNNSAIKELKEESLLATLAFKYLPFWPLFIALTALSATLAWVYIRYTTTIYSATASILIKDEDKGMTESELSRSLNPLSTNKMIENEILLISSKNVSREVVKNLRLYAPLSRKGKIKTSSGYTTSPIIVEVKNPEKIAGKSNLIFQFKDSIQKVFFRERYYDLNEWFLFDDDSLRFLSNSRGDMSIVNEPVHFSLVSVNSAANGIKVKATPNGYSTVVDLYIEDEVPERAVDILNEIINVYERESVADKNALAANTMSFVEQRLNYVVNDLDSVEGALQRYKSAENVVDLSSQGEMFLENVSSVDKQLSEMNVRLNIIDAIERFVRSSENNSAILPSTLGIDDPLLTELIKKLYELEVQREQLKKYTAENNPILISVNLQIDKLKPTILENIRGQRTNMLSTRKTLEKRSGSFSTQLRALPQKERGLLDISRQQAIKNSIYTFLLEKREEAALSFGSAISDTRIVNSAEPAGIVKPKTGTIYLMAIAIGLLVAIAAISLKDTFNNKIIARKEIERHISWPILAEIVHNPTKEAVVTGKGMRNAIAEQFRHLRTSLSYLGINQSRKKIMITSSVSGEGKSFIALNLANSLALTDKKVLLIEMDLRKPKMAGILNRERTSGVSNYLVGSAELQDIIQTTDINSNLFFISSGALPLNPAELILSERMATMLSQLEKSFDFLIIDSAPVVPVTDSHILSKLCDVTLFVVRHKVTKKFYIKRIEATNSVIGLKNVGIIFNAIKKRRFGMEEYGYGYGYGYGAGYGEPEKNKRSKNATT